MNRARGALMGLAVGDALGTTLEFTKPSPRSFAERVDGPHREVTGGGPFAVAPGQVTDDTAVAACLADPRCALACAAFDAAIGACVAGEASRGEELVATARAALAPAAALLHGRHAAIGGGAPDDAAAVTSGAREIAEDLDAALRADPELYGALHLHRTQGFVRVAFRLAFWSAVHVDDFEEALVDVVNRGGDADTNGAIVGALLGARLGESAIPARWRAPVLDALRDGPPGPLRDDYHPRVLLGMLDGR